MLAASSKRWNADADQLPHAPPFTLHALLAGTMCCIHGLDPATMLPVIFPGFMSVWQAQWWVNMLIGAGLLAPAPAPVVLSNCDPTDAISVA